FGPSLAVLRHCFEEMGHEPPSQLHSCAPGSPSCAFAPPRRPPSRVERDRARATRGVAGGVMLAIRQQGLRPPSRIRLHRVSTDAQVSARSLKRTQLFPM